VPTYGELEGELARVEQEAAANPALVQTLAPGGLLRKKYVEALSKHTGGSRRSAPPETIR
jgi:hypothetical protein